LLVFRLIVLAPLSILEEYPTSDIPAQDIQIHHPHKSQVVAKHRRSP
jgi:hypothetical protein